MQLQFLMPPTFMSLPCLLANLISVLLASPLFAVLPLNARPLLLAHFPCAIKTSCNKHVHTCSVVGN